MTKDDDIGGSEKQGVKAIRNDLNVWLGDKNLRRTVCRIKFEWLVQEGAQIEKQSLKYGVSQTPMLVAHIYWVKC